MASLQGNVTIFTLPPPPPPLPLPPTLLHLLPSEEDAFRTVFGSSSESEEEEEEEGKAAADLKPPLPESEAKEIPTKKAAAAGHTEGSAAESASATRSPSSATPGLAGSPPKLKPRPPGAEEVVLREYSGCGLDEEDVGLLRLAMTQLRGVGSEGAGLLDTLCWAHYPSDILSRHALSLSLPVPLPLPLSPSLPLSLSLTF